MRFVCVERVYCRKVKGSHVPRVVRWGGANPAWEKRTTRIPSKTVSDQIYQHNTAQPFNPTVNSVTRTPSMKYETGRCRTASQYAQGASANSTQSFTLIGSTCLPVKNVHTLFVTPSLMSCLQHPAFGGTGPGEAYSEQRSDCEHERIVL